MQLDQALKANRGIGPGFHMLRHALSWAILTTHAWYAVRGMAPVKTFGGVPLVGSTASAMTYGDMARELFRPSFFALVGMFFALSGFLVAGSALRTRSVKVFFINRALRILPALSVEVALSAFVLGPLVTTVALSQYFTDPVFFRYFGNIVGHITYYLPGVFASNPWPRVVNATLWTLPAEFWCYAIMLLMMITGIIAHNRRVTIGLISVTLVVVLLTLYDPVQFTIRDGVTHFTAWYIVLMFLFGVLLYVNAEHVPLKGWIFWASAVLYYALMVTGRLEALSGIPLAYCMVYIGMMKFPKVDRLIPVDVSYGTYLYGFPITQALIFFLYPTLRPFGLNVVFLVVYPLVIVLTVLFSAASWTYLEKPALSMRKHFLREPAPKPSTPA